jgi:hypothetical protein
MRVLYKIDLKKMNCTKLKSDLFHLPSLKFYKSFFEWKFCQKQWNSGDLLWKKKWNVNHNSVEFYPYVKRPERKCLEVFSLIVKGYNNMKYNI